MEKMSELLLVLKFRMEGTVRAIFFFFHKKEKEKELRLGINPELNSICSLAMNIPSIPTILKCESSYFPFERFALVNIKKTNNYMANRMKIYFIRDETLAASLSKAKWRDNLISR